MKGAAMKTTRDSKDGTCLHCPPRLSSLSTSLLQSTRCPQRLRQSKVTDFSIWEQVCEPGFGSAG